MFTDNALQSPSSGSPKPSVKSQLSASAPRGGSRFDLGVNTDRVLTEGGQPPPPLTHFMSLPRAPGCPRGVQATASGSSGFGSPEDIGFLRGLAVQAVGSWLDPGGFSWTNVSELD